MNIVEIEIANIKPYGNNAKKHDKTQIDNVAQSIKRYGFVQPIVVDKEGSIIIGHCRYAAAKKLKMKTVPCVRAEELTEDQVKELRLLDNKLNESEWDIDLLQLEVPELDFSAFEIDWGLPEDEVEPEAMEDDFDEELPEEPTSKRGDIYQLGRHRLMCGDSTILSDVENLVGGVQVDMLITDPPYNVDYTGKTKDALKIENDSMSAESFKEFLYNAFSNAYSVMKAGAAYYVWYASREVVNFQTALEDALLPVRQELIWNKNTMVMGRQDYQWKHEPCLYGWKEGAGHLWASDRKQTTIINMDRPTKSELHPTMKPIGLFDYQIKNNTKGGDKVLDLFSGSGTTIMACEQNGRDAYCMEYDPRYVDTIIKRWETFTGQKAVLLNGET